MAEATVDTPEKSLNTQYQETKAAHTEANNRLAVLRGKALTITGLTDDEELELLRLERRVSNLQPVLHNLERQTFLERERLDIESVVEEWDALVDEKKRAYADLYVCRHVPAPARTCLFLCLKSRFYQSPRMIGDSPIRIGYARVSTFE